MPIHRPVPVLLGSLLISVAAVCNAVEKTLFEDNHVRLVEVTHWPGESFTILKQQLPVILAVDAKLPEVVMTPLAKQGAISEGNRGVPPLDRPFPWCQVQSLHQSQTGTVKGDFPLHFYRMEYKRIDGDGFAANWKQWYPWAIKPGMQTQNLGTALQQGEPHSKDFPYSLMYDALSAAPANHFLRYRDAHVELVEVFIRPGESENIHGHPLPSVFFDDGGGFYPAIQATNFYLNPDTPLPRGAVGKPPAEMTYPSCYGAIAQWPHSVTVTGDVPQHFFRLQFIRTDGDEIQNNWQQWYPKSK